MTANQASHSARRTRLDVVETALVSAIFAWLPEAALLVFLLVIFLIGEELHGTWAWCLRLTLIVPACLTPLVAAVAGGVLAQRAQPPPSVRRWLLIGLGARAAALLCGALPFYVFPGPDLSIPSIILYPAALLLAVAAAAFPVPMMWAVIAHAVVSRRRLRIITRIALATLIVGAVALWAKSAVTGFVQGAQSVEGLSVSPSGRVYAATGAGIFAAGPKSTTLRYLRCGSLGTPATMVVADARNVALVWAGLAVPNALTTNLLESRDASKTWHPVAGPPPPDDVLSTSSAIYAKHDHDFETLWVNRSGQVGDWAKRPLKLPKIEAGGRVRVFANLMAASSQHPGLVMLAAEYGVSGTPAGGEARRGPKAESHGVRPGDTSAIPAGGETWRGALYRTRDFGDTWERVSIPLLVEGDASEQIDDIAIIPGSPEIVAVATWWGLLISSDEGRHWRRLKRPQGEHPKVFGAPTVPPTIYLLVEGQLYASGDLGRTWKDMRGGVSCIAISPAAPRTIYAGSRRGGVVRRWEEGRGTYIDYKPAQGGVYRSQDGGRSWRRLTYSFVPFGDPG